MKYNFDFLIAALIFLFFIFIHFIKGKGKLSATNNIVTMYFLILGMADIVFDIVTSLLVVEPREELRVVTIICFTVFFFMQVLFPLSIYIYSVSLRNDAMWKELQHSVRYAAIPSLAMMLVVLTNPLTGLIFTITESGEYVHGPLYMASYLCAFLYMLLIAIELVIHRREYGKKRCAVIAEYLFICVVTVAIQAVWNHLLMTGFGIALGLGVLYYTVNNPNALLDNFTGFFDHQHFANWTTRRFRHRHDFYAISIDLPQLQKSNKLYGTKIGDRMLLHVTEGLRKICPPGLVFRVKGSRLLVLMGLREEYDKVQSGIEELFAEPMVVGGRSYTIPAVVCGITGVLGLGRAELILPYIDYLVERVPDRSKTNFIQSDRNSVQNFLYERDIERLLPEAVQKDMFYLAFQPIYDLRSRRFTTLEVLSRMRHPEYGNVSPAVFVPLAERSGLVDSIGLSQFRKLCACIKERPDIFGKLDGVKFNLSPMELMKDGHCDAMIADMREYGIPGRFFRFEITETVATEYGETLLRHVEELNAAGVGLDLDDFGSGYANLNTVLSLPFGSIKIDRSLLLGINKDERRAMFYRNIATMLRDMGYTVIAEGVEERDELDTVAPWVDMVQGFYFSVPLTAEELPTIF